MTALGENAPSVYNDFHKKSAIARNISSRLITLLLLPLLLMIVRFANLTLIYHTNKQEITKNSILPSDNLKFMGFSISKTAQKNFQIQSGLQPQKTTILCHYNFIHPLIFQVNKRDNHLFTDLGRLSLKLDPGVSEITIYANEVVTIKHNNRIKSKYMGNALIKPLLDRMALSINPESEGKNKNSSRVSYATKSIDNSVYLKTPYTLYFYIPFLAIALLAFQYSKASYIGFFYFVEAFFLFDLKSFFAAGPFTWVFKLVNIEITPGAVMALSLISVTIFMLLTVIGIINWRRSEYGSREKAFIAFFLLLPLFLRF